MNLVSRAVVHFLAPLGAVTVCFTGGLLLSARAGAEAPEAEFPETIQPELGAAEYAPGDRITITSLRGNRRHIEPGGRYLLEGTYTLASAETADLAWFATSPGPGGSTPVQEDEHMKVTKGSGSFRLRKTLQSDAWLHVSFYVDGHSHGGVYFGESGVEKTVLRQKGWSDFSRTLSSSERHDLKTLGEAAESLASEPANLAILAYLGRPVAAPANLDAKYNPPDLKLAFTDLSKKLGLRVQTLAVDDSEFPFLLYGLLAGEHEFQVLANGLRELNDYGYGGSVVGVAANQSTYFSLNIIPQSQIPRNQAVTCNRRLMVRLQMLADLARASK